MIDSAVETATTTFPVDAEHTGFRLAIFGLFFLLSAAGYLLLSMVLPSEGLNLFALIGGLLFGFVLSAYAERLLKVRWPSGRAIQIDPTGARTLNRGVIEKTVRADEPASILQWRFQTRRRTRVPKGWFVVACALEQDNNYLSVYTFMSPDDLKQFDSHNYFATLPSRKESQDKSKGRDALLLAGQQRRLMDAESHRWIDGAEMTAEDFKTCVTRITEQYPQWTR
jgi:hypothetical protein